MKSVYMWLGWVFCEIGFKTDLWGPFASCYQLGCWFYGKALAGVDPTEFAIPNPYAEQPDAAKEVDDGTRL